MMDCPICDESFSDKNLFSQHIEQHKANSVLNKEPESIHIHENPSHKQPVRVDLDDFFVRDQFEKTIGEKMTRIDYVDELVHRRNFVEQIKKISTKHPFVYVPYFIKDLFAGADSAYLLKKYHILSHLELKNIVQQVLGLDRDRYQSKHYDDAFAMNIKVPTWKEKYYILQDNCKFFKNDIVELTFHNVLRAFILLCITDYVDTGISRKDMLRVSTSLEQNYDLFKFIDDELKSSFAVFYEKNFEQTVQDILDGLITTRILRRKSGTSDMIVGKMSLDILKKSIVENLKYSNGSKAEQTLRAEMKYEYPSLQLLPGLGVWGAALNELAHESIIQIKSKHNFRHSSIVFLSDDYQKIQQQLRMPGTYSVEFHGRKISPDLFIDELLELEKGDFEDKDDQVTRIAGLMLAESVKLQAPHESIPQFDFSIDITNYHFRDEQLDVMRKLDFKINSNILHCRVMLDETLTLETYEEILSVLPKNEQGAVITFVSIPDDVQSELDVDDSIQIIDEKGIRLLVSITAKIPARVGSVAKLHNDPISKLEKKLVKVNLLNYEDGLASVTVLPDNYDVTVLSRSLEEVVLNEGRPKHFELFTSRYLEFLNMLMSLTTPNNLARGLFETEVYESVPVSASKFSLDFRYSQVVCDLKWRNKSQMLDCNCMQWRENRFDLCSHLVCSLDHVARESFLVTWDDDGNSMKDALEHIIQQNIPVILDRLGLDHNQKGKHYNRMKEFISCMSQLREC